MTKKTREHHVATKRLHAAIGDLAYTLDCFGDEIARRESYSEHTGMDAVHYYLIQQHHWLPSQVRHMSTDDLHFLLLEEMKGWTLPKEARD